MLTGMAEHARKPVEPVRHVAASGMPTRTHRPGARSVVGQLQRSLGNRAIQRLLAQTSGPESATIQRVPLKKVAKKGKEAGFVWMEASYKELEAARKRKAEAEKAEGQSDADGKAGKKGARRRR